MSNDYEDFSDNEPLTEQNQSAGSKQYEQVNNLQDAEPIEIAEGKPYQVKNVRYGEKTVTGRVVGRKKTVIPEEEFLKLAELHCTWQEISDWYDVPVGTLRDNFADLYKKGTTTTKQRLRQAQLKLAINSKDRVMLIWLGKQMLQQGENGSQSADDSNVLPWNESADN